MMTAVWRTRGTAVRVLMCEGQEGSTPYSSQPSRVRVQGLILSHRHVLIFLTRQIFYICLETETENNLNTRHWENKRRNPLGLARRYDYFPKPTHFLAMSYDFDYAYVRWPPGLVFHWSLACWRSRWKLSHHFLPNEHVVLWKMHRGN